MVRGKAGGGAEGRNPGSACLTSEQLQVREGLGQDPPALLLHRQRDHQQPVGQLREVLDEVVLPVERSRETARSRKQRLEALGGGGSGQRGGAVGQEGRKPRVTGETGEWGVDGLAGMESSGSLNPSPENRVL